MVIIYTQKFHRKAITFFPKFPYSHFSFRKNLIRNITNIEKSETSQSNRS